MSVASLPIEILPICGAQIPNGLETNLDARWKEIVRVVDQCDQNG